MPISLKISLHFRTNIDKCNSAGWLDVSMTTSVSCGQLMNFAQPVSTRLIISYVFSVHINYDGIGVN